MKYVLDFDAYKNTAIDTITEGQILLKNDNEVLPVKKDFMVSVFGRMQFHYYKSGLGSGGMVNVKKVTGILEALEERSDIKIYEPLKKTYLEWDNENPLETGCGWGADPWSQKEMDICEKDVQDAAANSDMAIVIIARTAGEDQDNVDKEGAFRLYSEELSTLKKVRKAFDKMAVVLNIGNIIDFSFIDEVSPDAVLIAWQGGMEGGYGTAKVLMGDVTPSGHLPVSVAYELEDYPSSCTFGRTKDLFYEEDIYVGYRYFETAAKDKVQFPFGYGLSYTEFSIEPVDIKVEITCKNVSIRQVVEVTNIGNYPGKEVVMQFVSAPMGKLGKPSRVLTAFTKTEILKPGEKQTVTLNCEDKNFASFDDAGALGFGTAWVLEKGGYSVLAGENVRKTVYSGSFVVEKNICLEKLESAMAPVRSFDRMKAVVCDMPDDIPFMIKEKVPVRKISQSEKRDSRLPEELKMTGDKGYKLIDVKNGKVSMDDFIAQLTEDELISIVRGEGMGSPKVTPGTAAAYGGVSDSLAEKGIPACCCDDGPSGMRLDTGARAFSLPNGFLIASTFNTELVESLYEFTSVEMVNNNVDNLLGPGMNIHRHPLNGRNFEYFSEDPLVTGSMASAILKGLHYAGVTGTVKHFAGNNQETKRHFIDSVISERALREIYLKAFEMVVKEGVADSFMTTYGSLNGTWTSSCYDLNTTILREQWGFKGIVMTDWWAMTSEEGGEGEKNNFAAMVRAQNDLYMVCPDSSLNKHGDNLKEALDCGKLTIAELQRSAANICGQAMNMYAFERLNGNKAEIELEDPDENFKDENEDLDFVAVGLDHTCDLSKEVFTAGTSYSIGLDFETMGMCKIAITASSDLGELAQLPVTLFYMGKVYGVYTFNGTGGKAVTLDREIFVHSRHAVFKIFTPVNGLKIESVRFTFI
ncbi:MAG: glycoside hydrolase family 3 protein [Lachnospiraceae bacterium]|nr:glycoside hydrolase family 3 protein [Lachnospiraceae bacterium]